MSDKYFVDSNILIYAHTNLDIRKQKIAQQTLSVGSFFISTQVINEFINASRRKFKKDWKEIKNVVDEISSYSDVQTVTLFTIEKAIELSIQYKYSYYDTLIIAAALGCGCTILYSEDLQHKQKISKTLSIINPFFELLS